MHRLDVSNEPDSNNDATFIKKNHKQETKDNSI